MENILFTTSLIIVVGVAPLLFYRHHLIIKVVKNSLRLTVEGCLREIKIKNKLAYRDNIKKEILLVIIRASLLVAFLFVKSIVGDFTKAYAYVFLAPVLLLGFKDLIDLISNLLTLIKLNET